MLVRNSIDFRINKLEKSNLAYFDFLLFYNNYDDLTSDVW